MADHGVKRVDSEWSIARQIEAPESYFQCVCLSSTVDGFTAGHTAGNTLYNLYRSPAVRTARVPGRIWHWVPVAGRHWMGLVMVDSPGAVETVTVKLRDAEIAPVVADLGDGRRHLYYWPEAYDFEFAETLEILTPADEAPYVIEGFLFTPWEPYDEPLRVQTPPAVLAAPAFVPAMLPETVRVENPTGQGGPQLLTLSLALPGLAGVNARLDGKPCLSCLKPLTFAPDGTAVNQQVQVLADLPAATACSLSLAPGEKRGLPAAGFTVTAGAAGLIIPGLATIAPAMPGGNLRLLDVPGWTDTETLRPAFSAVYSLAAPAVELEITLTARFTPGLDEVEIEHQLLITGPDEFVIIPALTLEVRGEGGAGAAVLTASGPELAGEPIVANDRLALAAADFAALYPATLRAAGPLLAWDLLPAGFTPPELPRREYDKRFFHLTGDGYKLRRGLCRRHVCLLGASRERLRAWLDPARLAVTRDYRQGLLTPAPTPPEPHDWRTRTLEAWRRQQRELHGFGFPNYGDWFGERFCNWGNGEYDSSYGLLLQYVQTGDASWATLGHAAARHLLEVDTAHRHPERPGWQYAHCMGHVGGYYPNSYEVGAYGDASKPNVAHCWVEGMLLHYLLTGDRLALETARKYLDDLSGPALATKYFSNGRDMGWHLIHLNAGAAVLREPRYLAAADALVRLILERQRPDGSWRRVLNSDHCTCYPHHTGNTGFMLGVLMEGLAGYHELTGDPRVADAIRRAGLFLWNDIRDPETGYWHYTSCPNSRLGPPGGSDIHWLAPMMYSVQRGEIEAGLAAAWSAAVDQFIAGYCAELEKPPVVARLKEAPGKQMSKALRLVPKVVQRRSAK